MHRRNRPWTDLGIDVARRFGIFLLAMGVAFIIMLLVIAPLLALAWWLLRYAAKQ